MRKSLTVAASAVLPGDWLVVVERVSARRTRVVTHKVRAVRQTSRSVVIETAAFSTWKHPREGVAIERLGEDTRAR